MTTTAPSKRKSGKHLVKDEVEKRVSGFTSTYTRIDAIPVLHPNNPTSYRLWTDACKIYFPREYGNFIATRKKFEPIPTVMPRRLRQAAAASTATTAPATASTTKATAKAAPVPSQAKTAAESNSADSDSQSEASESSEVTDSSDAEADDDMNLETAQMVHAELVNDYTKSIRHEQRIAPEMYATLRSNWSEESVQLLSQEHDTNRDRIMWDS